MRILGIVLTVGLCAGAARGQEVDVTIHHFAFDPNDITIPAGTMVHWHNHDSSDHTVTTQTGPGTLQPDGYVDSPIIFPDEMFDFTFPTPGIHYYYCTVHGSSMQGVVRVLPRCGSADYNGDGDLGTDSDIEAFFACLSGSCCGSCGSADFNGDGDLGTDADIESFFRVLAGGAC